ncbi:MAG: protein kinase domain-containing protein [Kofleriaceae bacterium]
MRVVSTVSVSGALFGRGTVLREGIEVRELVSEGVYGHIYTGWDTALEREIVVKAAYPAHRGALRREARLLASLRGPGLVSIFAHGALNGIEYTVHERVFGTTLATHLALRQHTGGLTTDETLHLLARITATLLLLHGANAAHGDIRTETVVLAANGEVLLPLSSVEWGEADPVSESSRPSFPSLVGEPLERRRDAFALATLATRLLASVTERRHLTPELRDALHALQSTDPHTSLQNTDLLAALRRNHDRSADPSRVPTVVVADDDPDMRRLLDGVVRQSYPTAKIWLAEDGAAAIRLVEAHSPDLLLLDLEMPTRDGFDVCRYLDARSKVASKQTTVCVVSDHYGEHRSLLATLGVDNGFEKRAGNLEALEEGVRGLLAPEPRSNVPRAGMIVSDRYELARLLGTGGMGTVFEARHVELNKRFALKIIGPSLALDTAARERFRQEARLASELAHPNIVSVVDFGEDDALGAYMVMELVEGESLSNVVGPDLPIARACDLLGQVADALAFVHRHGIVHGDVKADNIMLVEERSGARRRRIARLLDFGLAHRLTMMLGTTELSGTPDYLAPERIAGEPPGVAGDIYALGVLGYFLLTGVLPFEGSMEEILLAQLRQSPAPLSARRGVAIDPALEALIARAMAKSVTERHATVDAFRYELNTAMDMLGIGHRRRSSKRIAAVEQRSLAAPTIGQAVVTAEGTLLLVNAAFRAAVGADLASIVRRAPDFWRAVETARRERVASHCLVDDGSIVIGLVPIPGSDDCHLMVGGSW